MSLLCLKTWKKESFYGQLWCLLKLTSAMQAPRAVFGDKIKRKPRLQSLPFPQVPLVWHQTGGLCRNLVAFELWTNTTSYCKKILSTKPFQPLLKTLFWGWSSTVQLMALISVSCWWLTLKAAEPQENHSPGYLSIKASATVTTKLKCESYKMLLEIQRSLLLHADELLLNSPAELSAHLQTINWCCWKHSTVSFTQLL